MAERKKGKATLRFQEGEHLRMCDLTGVDALVAHKMLLWLPGSEKPAVPAWGEWVVSHRELGLRVTPFQLPSKEAAVAWAQETNGVIPWASASDWTSGQKARYRRMATRIWESIRVRFPVGGPTSDESPPSSASASTSTEP